MSKIETTLPAFFDRIATQHADRIAVEDGASQLTFAELRQSSRDCARALIASGVEAGDRVLLWAPNRTEWLIAAFGIAHAGAVLIPANTRFKGIEIEELAARADVRLVISVGHFLGQSYPEQLPPETRNRAREVIVIGDAPGPDTAWAEFMARAEHTSEHQLAARIAGISPETTCDILFTSGTTGRSKGVIYAQGQFLRIVDSWADRVGLVEGDRVLVIPPFFHSFGYRAAAMGALIAGATILPEESFDAEAVLTRIETDRISVIPGPPTVFTSLMSVPGWKTRDLTSLRLGITGAATIPEALIVRMRTELGLRGVCNGYGLSEAGGFGTITRADDPVETVSQTSGRAMAGMELAVFQGDTALPPGEHGEIRLRGYSVMQGYLDDPESTAKAIDPAGWLHTGDIGWLDADGNLHVEDRMKDMYICGGFNCYPAEIERVLTGHPAVSVAAVIGVADARMGEVGKAFVILREGTVATPDDILTWAGDRLANFKRPRSLEICEALPLGPSGKVLKRMLS